MNITYGNSDTGEVMFGWVDYMIFLIMLTVSTLIGVYFGFWGKKEDSTREYLFGGKTMRIVPVSVSLISTSVSGITLLGVPTEIYRFGTLYVLGIFSFLITGIVTYYIYLPVFYDLQLTSSYEYFELRYNYKIRIVGSILFTFSVIVYTTISVYIPAMTLSLVCGINLHVITVVTSILCIVYTMLGGLKAVVWTDFLQGMIMLLACIIIIILGVHHVGGFKNVWKINQEGGRIQFLEMNPSPFIRQSFWTIIFGLTFFVMNTVGTSPVSVQKFISLPTLQHARWSLLILCVGWSLIVLISGLTGLLIYSAYFDCDPIQAKAVRRPDQLTTYFVLDVAGHIPGLPGLFIAGLFSAALSTMSSQLNSIGATVFEDFVRPSLKGNISHKTAIVIIRCIVSLTGAVCLLLVIVVEKFESILQVCTVLFIFCDEYNIRSNAGIIHLGMLYPRGNTAHFHFTFGSDRSSSRKHYQFINCWLDSFDGCESNLNLSQPAMNEEVEDGPFILYQVSYMYYPLIGLILMLAIGAIVSHVTEPPELDKMNPKLFALFNLSRTANTHSQVFDEFTLTHYVSTYIVKCFLFISNSFLSSFIFIFWMIFVPHKFVQYCNLLAPTRYDIT
ncbi:hypothetical protein L9F63_007573, partial [Diploptera punctata]